MSQVSKRKIDEGGVNEEPAKRFKSEGIFKLVSEATNNGEPITLLLQAGVPLKLGRTNHQLTPLLGHDNFVSREAASLILHPTEDLATITVVR